MDCNILKRLGIKIGHYTDEDSLTGLTCFIAEEGACIGIDIRGSNSATLNTPGFGPKAASDMVHAVVLTGGSTFGLESTFGVIQYLEERNIGYHTRAAVIPGIVAAVIYDVAVGNGRVRPTKENGYLAAREATDGESLLNAQGNVGVGTGATIGKWAGGIPMKGGFGIGVSNIGPDIVVAAFVVTNAVGDIVNPKTGQFYSDCGRQNLVNEAIDPKYKELVGLLSMPSMNTTLAVVATNINLQKNQLSKVAEQAHNGMARAIHPIHTNLDGDVIFALSSKTGENKTLLDASAITVVDLVSLAAADATVKGINNSIRQAKSIEGFPAYQISNA
jgi:L-aminopeptidase/D-esterase-like protein